MAPDDGMRCNSRSYINWRLMLIDKIKSYIERALSHKNMFLNMLGSSIPNVNSNTYENSIKGN